jgi:hypothetical protein
MFNMLKLEVMKEENMYHHHLLLHFRVFALMPVPEENMRHLQSLVA